MTNDDLRAMRDEMAARAEGIKANARMREIDDDKPGANDIAVHVEAAYRLLTNEQAHGRLGLEHLDPREREEVEAEHDAAMRAIDAAYQENLSAA